MSIKKKKVSRRNSSEEESWTLVKFIDDGIWHVCPPSRIRIFVDIIEVKWPPNGKWYRAEVYASGTQKAMAAAKNKMEQTSTLLTDEIQTVFHEGPETKSEEEMIQMKADDLVPNILQEISSKDTVHEVDNNEFEDSDYIVEKNGKESSFDEVVLGKEMKELNSSFGNNTHNIDYTTQKVYPSGTTTKQHFCPFCFKLQTKFARHLELKHKDLDAVEKIISLPKGSLLRLKALSEIRNKGDYLFNSESNYNLGHIIPVRRPQNFRKREATHYKVCGSCKGLYSVLTLAAHYRKCNKDRGTGKKDVMVNSRRNDFMHREANNIMKNRILPKMRNDKVNNVVRSQKLIIVFGNRLTSKYRSPHFASMIRSRLRCVANFFLHVKELKPELINFEEVFKPFFYDDIVEAINKMAGLDESTGKYRAPATAFNIGSYLKKIAFYLVSETIKSCDKKRQEEIRDLITLMEEGFPYDVYKTVNENQVEMKIKKKIVLPTESDILKLKKYLDKNCKNYAQRLKNEYSFLDWKELLSLLLVSLLLFNRRRVGEMERVKIDDFQRFETLDSNATNYVRFLIRGKLARGVPVMIHKEKLSYLKLILKFREKAGVSPSNPYLFAIPSEDNFEHLSATRLLYKYARECGAQNPETLKGTELRKQLATKCGTMDLGQTEIKDVANYMGHHEQIHLNHYRMPDAAWDITRMSTILEKAQGSSNDVTDTNNNNSLKCDNLEEDNINLDLSNHSQSSNQRRSWNEDEKVAIAEEAEDLIKNFEMPSLQYCTALCETIGTLKERSPAQVKAYIAYCIKKEKAQFLTPNKCISRKSEKHFWTSPEKKEVLNYFGNLMKEEIVPSLKMCANVIKKSTILKARTPEMLKAFINNCIKKSLDKN